MAAKKQGLTKAEVMGLVDELGRIDVRLKSVALDAKRGEVIKSLLRSLMDASPADAPASFAGAVFVAAISERRFEKSIDNAQLYKAMGKDGFLAIAHVSQNKLPEYLTAVQVAAMTTEARTGSRTVTTVFKQVAIEVSKAA